MYPAILDLIERGVPFATALVLKTDGSTPGRLGARAIIHADGTIQGTVGGGAIENEARRRAVDALRSGHAELLEMGLGGASLDDPVPVCGGSVRLLIDPLAARHCGAYSAAAESIEHRARGVLLTHVCMSGVCSVEVEFIDEQALAARTEWPVAAAIRDALQQGQPHRFAPQSGQAEEQWEVLVEPLLPGPLLLIAGGGHIGQALAAQAPLVGFHTTVYDDRPEYTSGDLYAATVTRNCGDIAEQLARQPLDRDTYVVIVTRDHQHDAEALLACLGRSAAYIGMIGSQRKVAQLRKELLDTERATPQQLEQLYAPIGLDVGAQTPAEIATSILAQLIAVRRRGTAPRIGLA